MDGLIDTHNGPDTGLERDVAKAFDCITEGEFLALTKITPKTAETRRKRRLAPAYILVGNNYLYPRQSVAEWLRSQVREPREVDAKDAL